MSCCASMEKSEQKEEPMEVKVRRVVRALEIGKSRQHGVVEELIRLERRIFPKHESLAESLEKELQKRNVGLLYVMEDGTTDEKQAFDGRAVAGYLMYSCSSVMASITKLAVRDSCRRKGYGEALLKAAMERVRLKRLLCVNLHVDPLRTPALSLYRKLGFKVDTLLHSYYGSNRDAYRMVLLFDYGI